MYLVISRETEREMYTHDGDAQNTEDYVFLEHMIAGFGNLSINTRTIKVVEIAAIVIARGNSLDLQRRGLRE